jgi:hypothetical protein
MVSVNQMIANILTVFKGLKNEMEVLTGGRQKMLRHCIGRV